MATLNHDRYYRQLIIDNIGDNSQLLLKNSSVLIVGLGGLGSPVALYLAAAGVGTIIACDDDVVELSNLNRQVLHFTPDINQPKSASAKEKLQKLNPEIELQFHNVTIDGNNIAGYAKGVDVIIDCLDNINTRMVLNEYSIKNNVPIVHGGVRGWNGQVTLLNPPETPCMQCLFNATDEPDGLKPIMGAVAGIVGTHQALAAIKYLLKIDTGLKNQLLFFDGLAMEWTKVPVEKDKICKACGNFK